MSITIDSNKNDTISNEYYIKNNINFTITNISVALANSIRRTILSGIPSVAFDDTWLDNKDDISIDIINNTTGLHNEFLSHRLSLIPINRYESITRDILSIRTIFNKQTKKRIFMFNTIDEIPIFKINKTHLIDSEDNKNNYGLLEVQSSDIMYSEKYESDSTCANYFQPDLYLHETKLKSEKDEYIIINMLKKTEEMEVYMTPTVGTGQDNSRYCTVGTVSYKFNIDEDNTEKVFEQILERENKERLQKNLNVFKDEEVVKKKQSFNLLDIDRVCLTNKYNEPNSFSYCVESIGMLPSHQIVYDSLVLLKLHLQDIVFSCNGFIKNGNDIVYHNKEDLNNKVNIFHSIDNILGYKIIIQNCNHTLGNLINSYINVLFVNNYKIEIGADEDVRDIPDIVVTDLDTFDIHNFNQDYLQTCGYKMPHPLKEEVEFKLKLNDMGEFKLFERYTKACLELNTIYDDISTGDIETVSNKDMKKTIILNTFIKSINVISDILSNILSQWKNETSRVGHEISTSSFIIDDLVLEE